MKETQDYAWLIQAETIGNNVVYKLIDTDSKGIPGFTGEFVPYEELKIDGWILPYPDPFEVLTIHEAVFQRWIRDVIKSRIGNFNLNNCYEDSDQYGPIYIEEFVDTDKATNITIKHCWNKFDDKICYQIIITYKLKGG